MEEENDPQLVDDFNQEKSILRKLSLNPDVAPYIPKMCNAVIKGNNGYIIQKYEDVKSLREFLDDIEFLPSIYGFLMINNLLKGFKAIHEAGYLHRDIKPENILIRMDLDKLVYPIIIDFGLACKLPCHGAFLAGTPLYLPQNVIDKQNRFKKKYFTSKVQLPFKQSKRSDKYALSLVLEEIYDKTEWLDGKTEEQNQMLKIKRDKIFISIKF